MHRAKKIVNVTLLRSAPDVDIEVARTQADDWATATAFHPIRVPATRLSRLEQILGGHRAARGDQSRAGALSFGA